MSTGRVFTVLSFTFGLLVGFVVATNRGEADPPTQGAGSAPPAGAPTAPAPVACTAHNECRVVFRRVHQISGASSCGPCGCCPSYEPYFDPPAGTGASTAPTTQAIDPLAEADAPSVAHEPTTLEAVGLEEADELQSSTSMRSRSRRPQQPIVCPACPGPTPVRAACVEGSCRILQ